MMHMPSLGTALRKICSNAGYRPTLTVQQWPGSASTVPMPFRRQSSPDSGTADTALSSKSNLMLTLLCIVSAGWSLGAPRHGWHHPRHHGPQTRDNLPPHRYNATPRPRVLWRSGGRRGTVVVRIAGRATTPLLPQLTPVNYHKRRHSFIDSNSCTLCTPQCGCCMASKHHSCAQPLRVETSLLSGGAGRLLLLSALLTTPSDDVAV
jgi:hypothetical protein